MDLDTQPLPDEPGTDVDPCKKPTEGIISASNASHAAPAGARQPVRPKPLAKRRQRNAS